MDWLVFIEKLTHILNLKHKSEIIIRTPRMNFFLCTNSCYFYKIQISYSLSFKIRHKVI